MFWFKKKKKEKKPEVGDEIRVSQESLKTTRLKIISAGKNLIVVRSDTIDFSFPTLEFKCRSAWVEAENYWFVDGNAGTFYN